MNCFFELYRDELDEVLSRYVPVVSCSRHDSLLYQHGTRIFEHCIELAQIILAQSQFGAWGII